LTGRCDRFTLVLQRSVEPGQYTSLAFGKRCKEAGVRPSMGSVGDAYDNAMCESFFATLECELLERRRFASQAEARMACFGFRLLSGSGVVIRAVPLARIRCDGWSASSQPARARGLFIVPASDMVNRHRRLGCWPACETGSSRVGGRDDATRLSEHAVWLCFRFPLSLRMVDEPLAARGIVASHGTVRQWALKSGRGGQDNAPSCLRRRSGPGRRSVFTPSCRA